MDDWVQVTDIATRLAYPLEYLRGAPNTVCSSLLLAIDSLWLIDGLFKETPVAILIGITPQGIPEPGVSSTLFALAPPHSTLMLICDYR